MSGLPVQPDSARVNDFVALLGKHQLMLFRYIFALVPRVQDAEDVLQEVSKTLWQRFGDYEPGTDFFAWAKRVAYFRVLEFRRGKERRVQILPEDVLQTIVQEIRISDEWEAERREALANCIAGLRPGDRDLITARYTPGISIANLAVEISRPVNSVYKSLGRIRQSLLACVERRLGQIPWERGSS
jgi:RNA polymerase sigma-70 factor (ECF subfamily)